MRWLRFWRWLAGPSEHAIPGQLLIDPPLFGCGTESTRMPQQVNEITALQFEGCFQHFEARAGGVEASNLPAHHPAITGKTRRSFDGAILIRQRGIPSTAAVRTLNGWQHMAGPTGTIPRCGSAVERIWYALGRSVVEKSPRRE
jgi:hypothetical protein